MIKKKQNLPPLCFGKIEFYISTVLNHMRFYTQNTHKNKEWREHEAF